METLKLQFPITIDDQQIETVEYDLGKANARNFLSASKRRNIGGTEFILPANDTLFMFELGIEVLLASNAGKGWSREDFDRVTGGDIFAISGIGQRFFLRTRDDVPTESSDAH